MMSTAANPATPAASVSPDLHGPRYTSYPTADRFVDTFGETDYRRALGRSARVCDASGSAPRAVYVHIPFCESICYYCACNKVVTRRHERAMPYLASLEREIALQVGLLGSGRQVAQVHLGGGTPTFLADDELARLVAILRDAFAIVRGAELSIEVDPRTVDISRLGALRSLGFNRLSFGVQDVDPAVQRAVHRVQSSEQVAALMDAARSAGFASINVDLIHGLPLQTPGSFARTIDCVAAMRPDRIALYAYAHLPGRFAPQRRIDAASLPAREDRLQMLRDAIDRLLARGYVYIGMDHFALPEDMLARAKAAGSLQRGFQGYESRPSGDLLGFGVSAISRVGDCYAQNDKTIEGYAEALAQGRLPVTRGLMLDADDLLRRDVIMALMCQGRIDYAALHASHRIRFADYFRAELARLAGYSDLGWIEVKTDAIEVTRAGWFFVRAIAMAFDRYLQPSQASERFSRVA